VGTGLLAQCSCGYETKCTVGAGRRTFKTSMEFPHHCKSCHEVVDVQVYAEELKCPDCGSTDVESYRAKTKSDYGLMFKWVQKKLIFPNSYHSHDDEHHSWRSSQDNTDHVILRGKHPCPKCGKNEMQFHLDCMFD
jgi:predicted RNA-binding Zn-ribbon protein involved in translation (DUF1610 family)